MIPMRAADVAAVVGGTLTDVDPDAVVTAPASHDSRAVPAGGVYVALVGERVDGHDFVAAATEAGAVLSITQRPVDGCPCVVTEDAQAALGRLGAHVCRSLPQALVVALTGSQGKTSTKDLIAQLLPELGPTVAPQGSFNTEVGVPVTATRADAGTRFLVIEMGARGIGHIRYLTTITPPTIGLVLNVGTSHLGEFGSRENIALAKGELVESLPAATDGGIAVLNADDPLVAAMAARTSARVVTFSAAGAADADVAATDVELGPDGCASFTLRISGPDGTDERRRVRLPLVGRHQVANALAAAAVAHEAGLDPDRIAERLSTATSMSHWRMEITEAPAGYTVVNDAYNANPESMQAAFDAVAAITAHRDGARTIAVLGPMGELGELSAEAHTMVGAAAARTGVDDLVAVGAEAAGYVDAYTATSGAGRARRVDDVAAAVAAIHELARPGDVVLVKGSRVFALERVATGLLAGPRGTGGTDKTNGTDASGQPVEATR